jgi:hypothetical protein
MHLRRRAPLLSRDDESKSMVRAAPFLVAMSIGLSTGIVGAALSDEFRLNCERPPFPMKTKARPIDGSCGNEGESKGTAKGLQNAVKNNLCSQGGTVALSFSDFMSLQQQARDRGIPFGADGFPPNRVEHLPEDRSELSSGNFHTVDGRPIREGDKVQIVAFMDDPHAADLGAGEDVNCHNKKAAENDIHINLVERPAPPKPGKNDPDAEQKKADRKVALCSAVVAEVIPHFRPDVFDAPFLVPIAEKNTPVRISGQLFFDAAHRPCEGSVPRDASIRGSLWEIHPIYSIDVCKNQTLDQCPSTNEAVWIPLDQSVGFFQGSVLKSHRSLRLKEPTTMTEKMSTRENSAWGGKLAEGLIVQVNERRIYANTAAPPPTPPLLPLHTVLSASASSPVLPQRSDVARSSRRNPPWWLSSSPRCRRLG